MAKLQLHAECLIYEMSCIIMWYDSHI